MTSESEAKFGQVVVIDNGGYSLKCGFAGDSDPQLIIPNHIARHEKNYSLGRFIGEQCFDPQRVGTKDFSQLNYFSPIDKGHITNIELQAEIWYVF